MKTYAKRFLSMFLMCMIVCTVFPCTVSAAYADCPNCGEYCSFYTDYEQYTSKYHVNRGWCSNCGKDIWQGTNIGNHSMSGGVCTLCGYDDGSGDSGGSGDDTCYHDRIDIDWDGCYWEEYCRYCGEVMASGIEHMDPYTEWEGCTWYDYCSGCDELLDYGGSHGSTYREWSGCTWYDYCRNCDTLMDSGTSHSTYTYGEWENYNSSRHRRTYACSSCGEGTYEYGYHTTQTEYTSYSSTQHQVTTSCTVCSYSTGSGSYESHDFSYGSWTNYSGSQHRRSVSCSDCGYSSYEYASHSLSYGSWTSTGSSQHRRTVSCSCGYSTTETKSHSLTYGSWTNYSDTQHRRSTYCSTCRYSSYDYASHSITTGNWTSISDTEHSRTGSCSCGYSGTETEYHDFSYGAWESYNDSEHRRTAACYCGYSGYEYADHEHTTETGMIPVDETQHTITYTCACGHTAEEPEDHTFSYGDWTEFSSEEHSREASCECGYSDTEYDDHTDSDTDGSCDECGYITSRFSVTVPAYLLVVISQDGTVFSAVTAEIINHSTAAVAVTDISFTTGNGWTLVPYTTEMADEKVDSRQIGFLLNGTDGYHGTLANDGRWIAEKDSSIPLSYDAVVSATSEILKDEQVLTIVFVLDWAA